MKRISTKVLDAVSANGASTAVTIGDTFTKPCDGLAYQYAITPGTGLWTVTLTVEAQLSSEAAWVQLVTPVTIDSVAYALDNTIANVFDVKGNASPAGVRISVSAIGGTTNPVVSAWIMT